MTIETLIQSGVIHKNRPLKILGNGELLNGLTVHAHKFSASAKSKIEAAGGKLVEVPWVVERHSRSHGPNLAMRNRRIKEEQ